MTSYKMQRQNEIDLLRIIAAFVVFMFHYTDSFNYGFKIVPGNLSIGTYFRYGYMGVMLFFVISGYVVTMSAMDKTFRNFWVSRISRLYPAFWISCFIAMLVPRIFPELPTYVPYPSLKLFFYNLTMIPSVFHKQMLSPVYWSLLEEMHFYLIISLVIIFQLWKRLMTVLIIWLIIYIIVGSLGLIGPDETVGFLVPKHSLYFMAGIAFYLLRISYTKRQWLLIFISIILACCIGYSFTLTHFSNQFYQSNNAVNVYTYIIINIAIFITFYLIAIGSFSIKNNYTLRLLGDLTYPFYLIHVFGLCLYYYLRDTLQPQLLLGFMLFVLLIVSFIINKYVEKPAIRCLKININRKWKIKNSRS